MRLPELKLAHLGLVGIVPGIANDAELVTTECYYVECCINDLRKKLDQDLCGAQDSIRKDLSEEEEDEALKKRIKPLNLNTQEEDETQFVLIGIVQHSFEVLITYI